MALNLRTTQALDTCAHYIAFGIREKIDLYHATRDPRFYDEAPAYLTEKVEELSEQRYTVREAYRGLFAKGARGQYLYLVRCSFGTEEVQIRELTEDMLLIGCGAYTSGLDLDAERSMRSPEEIRTTATQIELRTRQHREEDAAGKAAVVAILDRLKIEIDSTPDIDQHDRLTQRMRNLTYGDPSLKSVVIMLQQLGLDLVVVAAHKSTTATSAQSNFKA